MKKLTISFFVALFCFTQAAIAQVDISPATSATSSASSQLESLNSAIKSLKDKANAEFAKEQAAIDAEKQKLAGDRTSIEKDNAAEKDMMADKWPARVSAREALVKAEQANQMRQLKLDLRKKGFQQKVAQIEQKVKSSFVESVKSSLDSYNSIMTAYGSELSGVTY